MNEVLETRDALEVKSVLDDRSATCTVEYIDDMVNVYLNRVNRKPAGVTVDKETGAKTFAYGEFHMFRHEKAGIDMSDRYKYYEVWQDGHKKEVYFETCVSNNTVRIGPEIHYHPDGRVHRYDLHTLHNYKESYVISSLMIDYCRRSRSMEEVEKTFQSNWKKVAQKREGGLLQRLSSRLGIDKKEEKVKPIQKKM